MNIDLSKVGQRSQLGHRREPYWQRLRKGCFIGYRPSKSKLEGNWIARATCEDTRKYKHKKLGDYGSFAKHERFDVARKDAEKFFQLIFDTTLIQKQHKFYCQAFPRTTIKLNLLP